MAQWISACLFALSANIDNFPIGIAYGLRGMRIGAGGNLLIACLTGLGTAAAMLLGGGLARLIPPDTANALGCMLLVLMGLWMLYREAQGGMGAPEQPPADAYGTRLGLRESAALAAALMVNNVGFGVGARITGLSIVKTTACTFVCSLILLAGGAAVGRRSASGIWAGMREYARRRSLWRWAFTNFLFDTPYTRQPPCIVD